jgi:rare lipoprotein A
MRTTAVILFSLCATCIFVGCLASPRFTATKATRSAAEPPYSRYEEGIASFYSDQYHGRTTSNGEVFDMNKLSAAHRTLPFNTTVRVTNRTNGKSVIVRINDRGPFKDDRIIDLSLAAAKQIDLIGPGTAPVILEVVEFGPTDSTSQR